MGWCQGMRRGRDAGGRGGDGRVCGEKAGEKERAGTPGRAWADPDHLVKKLSAFIMALVIAITPGAISNKSFLFWETSERGFVSQPWDINFQVQIYFLKEVRRFTHLRKIKEVLFCFFGALVLAVIIQTMVKKIPSSLKGCEDASHLFSARGGLTHPIMPGGYLHKSAVNFRCSGPLDTNYIQNLGNKYVFIALQQWRWTEQ